MRSMLLAFSALVALPALALAQPVSGPYLAGGAGVNIRLDSTARLSGGTSLDGTPVKAKYTDAGAVGLASIGWGFGNGLRAEVEGNFRQNDLRRWVIGGTVAAQRTGYAQTYGAMVNALYDINLGSPVTPYVGLGLGYGWNDFRGVHGQVGSVSLRGTGVDGALAYQGILGAAYSLSSVVPGLSLTAEARYYGTGTPSINTTAAFIGGSAHGTVRPTNDNISGLIGFRYAFGAPAPVPPAPPPVAPARAVIDRTFIVFFDWDRADLTARAREIIREAAVRAQRETVTRIEVAGHADRSGDPAYNQRLSQRRAEAVAAELVRDGVARAAISVQGFGESRPLVPTADNAREPQNRRVEIVLR